MLRLVRSAAAPTAAVLAAVAVLLALTREPGLLVPVLSVLLALTVPHVAVVAIMDRSLSRPTTHATRDGLADSLRSREN